MPESNELLSAGAQLIGMPLAGPESFSEQQLTYLKRALGVDETELFYDATNHNVSTTEEFVMSESIWNFSKVRVILDNMEFAGRFCTLEIDLKGTDTSSTFITPWKNASDTPTFNIPWARFNINSSGNIKYTARGLLYGSFSNPQTTTGTSRGYRVFRVVGIGRISGGN